MQVVEPVFDETKSVLENWGMKITSAMGAALPPEKDVDGQLRAGIEYSNSVSISFTSMGFPITFQIALPDYWKYVDAGRRPGAKPPPIDVIRQWIINKHLVLNDKTAKLQPLHMSMPRKGTLAKRTKGQTDLTESKIKSLAFLFARAIGRDGIPAVPFVSSVITDGAIQDLQQQLTVSFKRDVIVHLNKTFS
jgi:hypothetical protein